jgi:tRNA nucleotidyltransferase (CCA-adding enzyme)
MHMPGAAAAEAIVPPAAIPPEATAPQLAQLAWRRLQPQAWPLPPEAFPAGAALVGGAVRDALLDRLPQQPDLDLVVPEDAIALCRQLGRRHGGSVVVLDAERSIARLVIQGWSIDLARQEGDSLEQDLRRRDYRLNAMALPLGPEAQLLDPLEGLSDLRRGQLMAVAEANLLDDPLRLLRGVRLASELGFALDPQTQHWLKHHHACLAAVAGERVLAELDKLAASPGGAAGLRQCLAWGLLEPWRAPTAAGTPQAEALLEGLGAAEAQRLGLSSAEAQQALPLARLAAVLDGAGLRRLRSSRRLQQRVEQLRRWRQRLGAEAPAQRAERLSEVERLRLQRDLEDDLPALLLSWPTAAATTWLERWRNPDDPLFHPRAAIDGLTLQRELGLPASPRLGALLQHLMQLRAFGRLNGRLEALEAAQRWLAAHPADGDAAPRRG